MPGFFYRLTHRLIVTVHSDRTNPRLNHGERAVQVIDMEATGHGDASFAILPLVRWAGGAFVVKDNSLTEGERLQLAERVGQRLLLAGRVCSTAESCTGGLIATLLTETAGSSAWFDSAAITYSNEAKQRMLGVTAEILSEHGAVSQACVEAMAAGSLERSNTDLAVSVSGIAGPGGGSADKPVGTVWLAWAWRPTRSDPVSTEARVFEFAGDRQQVRAQAATEALRGMLRVCDAADFNG